MNCKSLKALNCEQSFDVTYNVILVPHTHYRKYNRLSVRYSRLRQTPVRFTFTQEGEMLEEEDEEDHHSDEQPEDGSFPMEQTPS